MRALQLCFRQARRLWPDRFGSWLGDRFGPFRDGILVALFLVCWWHQVAASLGKSLAVDLAFFWALALGGVLGLSSRSRSYWLHLGLMAWSLALVVLLPGVVGGLEWLSLERIATADGIPAALLVVTILLAIPTGWAVRLAVIGAAADRLRAFLAGLGLGILAAAHISLGWIGVSGTLALASVLSGVVCVWQWMRRSREKGTPVLDWSLARRLAPLGALATVVAGFVFVSQVRMLAQLIPAAEWFLLTAVAGLCWGILIGCRVGESGFLRVVLPSCLLLLPALFPGIIDVLLSVKLFGGRPEVLLLVQSGVVLLSVIPLGAALPMLLGGTATVPAEASQESVVTRSLPLAAVPFLFVGGLVAGRCLLLPWWGVVPTMLVGAWCLMLEALPSFVRSRRSWIVRSLPLVLLLVVSCFVHRYQPVRSARILFSSRVMTAATRGWPRRLLESVDDGRLVEQKETFESTLSVWRHRGAQLHFRVDGVPSAVRSTDTGISPDHVPAVLEALLPLVFHDRPARVQVLGLGGGVALETCLGFPVKTVDCVEPDRGLRQLVSPGEDLRLQWHHLPAALAVSSRSSQYDVIISTGVSPIPWRSESTRSVEFYVRVAEQLASGGIFCQGLVAEDVGIEVVATQFRSLSRAFSTSVLVRVGSGRFLALGTNAASLCNRPGLVGRLQGPHVRAALARIGWDWATVLQLGVSDGDWAQGWGQVNSVRDGRLASRMPVLALRGATGASGWQRVLGRFTRPLIGWIRVEDDRVVEVRDRLADLKTGQRLLARVADGFRHYRRRVRQQLSKNPRHILRSVAGEGLDRVLHPDDQRRRRYFRILEEVVLDPAPSAATIERVTGFLAPYDPLLSEFVHREVAELWSRRGQTGRWSELRHRLHAIHFSSHHDTGVAEIQQAVDALLSVSAGVNEVTWEWDHLNALLDVLQQRWSRRMRTSRDFTDASNAIELVGRITERMQALVELDAALGRKWAYRREVIDRSLVDPLCDHRARLLSTRRGSGVLTN